MFKQKVNVKDFILLAQEMNEAHLENNIVCKGEKKTEHEQWKLAWSSNACPNPCLGLLLDTSFLNPEHSLGFHILTIYVLPTSLAFKAVGRK